MRLRTDDDIYRARLVYLGPPGYTLPIQLSYAQYGVFIVLVPLFMFIHYLFTLHFDLFPAWEIALAIVATSFIFRYVDPDRPARMVIRTALTDWHSTREPVSERREARLVATKIRIRDSMYGPLPTGGDRHRAARDRRTTTPGPGAASPASSRGKAASSRAGLASPRAGAASSRAGSGPARRGPAKGGRKNSNRDDRLVGQRGAVA